MDDPTHALRFVARAARPILRAVLALALLSAAAIVLRSLAFADGNDVRLVVRDPDALAAAARAPAPRTLTVVAWNIAKAFVHRGGYDFAPRADVEARLRAMADVLRPERPDLVVLSEVMAECGPCDVDQCAFLAEALDMPVAAFGECYAFGVPGFALVGGTAILARRPLRALGCVDLPERKPFWITTNNRRALLCALDLDGHELLLGALHCDSFDLADNARQAAFLRDLVGTRPALLAGDFNAEPRDASMRLWAATGRFTDVADAPPTFPAKSPERAIDHVLAPADWTLLERRTLGGTLSDHLALLCRFALPDG
ncbi:MAG: endonuclease/exonuclease/phosphatase family protein [Planctomycetes bacterium]|nr:endonuclease/exonuclease/phosphatase family protein [Planctomycetota bacterium]